MKLFLFMFILFFLVGCSTAPSESAVQTAISQTEIAKPTLTPSFTPSPIPTDTAAPTLTYTAIKPPSKTSTKAPTSTPKPTNTREPGLYYAPAPIGVTVERDTGSNFIAGAGVTMSATVLDVLRGKEADAMAKKDLGMFGYEEPIEGQEYLAVQVMYDVINASENEPFALYRGWHVALRYAENGDLFWPVDALLYSDTPVEKYPPFSDTFWIYFLVKEESVPFLYFQPLLFVVDMNGGETMSGAYFRLD